MSGKDMMMTTDNSGTAELSGPKPETEFYGYFRKDWIDLCEDIRDRDRVVYGVLRSLVYEHRGVRNDVRVVSLNDLCALIPGVNGKPTGLGGLRDSLRRLGEVGLVSDPEGNPLKTSSREKASAKPLRIRIHDLPCNDYKPRWKNADEKLAAIKAGCNHNPKEAAGCNCNPTGCDHNPLGCDANPDSGDDQAEHDPYFPSFTSSSTPPSETPAQIEAPAMPVARIGEGGKAAPEERGGPGLLDHSLAAVSLIGGIPKGTGIEEEKVVDAIVRKLDEGLDVTMIRKELLRSLPSNPRDLTGIYLGRLKKLGAEPVAKRSSAVSPVRADAHAYVDRYGSCETCSLPEANPRHRILAAVKTA